ncbi:acyl carrier protein [Stenotrophomonas mori]|nr:acyl carrier protein [Stenotrophomonas mori]
MLLEAKTLLSGCLFVPVEKIGDDDRLQTIKELDSLSFASIVVELESRIGHPVDPVELLELRSVRDVAGLLERHR